MDESTSRLLDAYIEQRTSPTLFLSSFFKLTERGIHASEHVEVDIRRGEPRLAVPVQDVTVGARKIETSKFENRKYRPAVVKLETPISVWSTAKRRPGENTFQDPDFRRAAREEAFMAMNECEDMTRRSVELQCAQILQTGVVDLKDENGVTIYTLDYQARPSHFLTTTAWAADGNTGDPFADIDALGIAVRRDGKQKGTDLIFGTTAMVRFLASAKVKTRLDNLGLQRLQEVAPADRPDGATFYGTMVIGQYKYNLWMYDGYYIDPETLEPTPYVGDTNVVMVAAAGRRDLTFGAIPQFVPPDARAMQFMPSRMSSVSQQFDMTTNVWVTPDGSTLTLSVGTRPLAVPTALDTFGCLTVA